VGEREANGYSYGWSKIVRDVMWVNVVKIELVKADGTKWDTPIPTVSARTLNRSAAASASGILSLPPQANAGCSISIELPALLDHMETDAIQVGLRQAYIDTMTWYRGTEISSDSCLFNVRAVGDVLAGSYFVLQIIDYPSGSEVAPQHLSVELLTPNGEGVLVGETHMLYLQPGEEYLYEELTVDATIEFSPDLATIILHELFVGDAERLGVSLSLVDPVAAKYESTDGTVNVVLLEPLQPNDTGLDFVRLKATVEAKVGVVTLAETDVGSLVFENPANPLPADPGNPVAAANLQLSSDMSTITVLSLEIGDLSLAGTDLYRAPDDPSHYISDDDSIRIQIKSLSPLTSEFEDVGVFRFTSTDVLVHATLWETGPSSLQFTLAQASTNPSKTGLHEDFRAEEMTFGFKVRFTSVVPEHEGLLAAIFGAIEGPTDRVLSVEDLIEVSPDVYETKVMYAVRDAEELTEQARQEYHDIVPVLGSGGGPVGAIIVGIIVGVGVAIDGGDYVVDEAWTETTMFFDGKESDTQIAWISNAFGSKPKFVDSSGVRFSKRFDQAGWTDDWTNYYAERNEILDDLRDMDGDDVFVYLGHAYTLPDEPGHRAVGLKAYSANPREKEPWAYCRPDLLKWAMQDKAPGLVIIMGCRSADGGKLQQTFTAGVDEPCKAYVGLTVDTHGKIAGEVLMRFLEELLVNRQTLQGAIDTATEKGTGSFRDYYFGEDNGDPSADITQRLLMPRGTQVTDVSGPEDAKHRQMVVIPASAGGKHINQLLGVERPDPE